MPDVVALSDSFVPSLPKGWNAAVRIKLADGTTDATVYKDANGDASGPNPLPLASADFGRNYDGNGGWQCYLVPGDYVVSVTPHGGSEHHTSVTVTAAAAGVTRALYEVYGTPSADVPVPTWNPDSGRLEFAAGGSGGGGASEQFAVYRYTVANQPAPLAGDNPLVVTGVGGAPVGTPDSGAWDAVVSVGSPVQCALVPGGAYIATLSWGADVDGGEYGYLEIIDEDNNLIDLHLAPDNADPRQTAVFVVTGPVHIAFIVGADTFTEGQNFHATFTFVKTADAPA